MIIIVIATCRALFTKVVCEELAAATDFQTYVAEKAVLEYVVVFRGDVVEARAGPSELCLYKTS